MLESTPWYVRTRLKTRQLLLLIAISDWGNLHRAAETLNMTQPAASKLLRELEKMLRTPLFERLPRGMRPNLFGEAMLRHARAVLGSLDHAQKEVEALKSGKIGAVAAGTISSPAVDLLPLAVSEVKRSHPGVRVTIEVENSNVLLERLAQGKLDFAIARLSVDHDKLALSYEPLAEEPICAVVRPAHPLMQKSRLKLSDVEQAAWIVPPVGSVLRHRFDLMFQRASMIPPTDVVETSATMFITRLLEESDMLAVLSADLARYYESFGMVSVLPLAMPCKMDEFGVITDNNRTLSPAAQVLASALRDVASRHSHP